MKRGSMKEFALENRNGLMLRVSEYGATAMELRVPDREGNFSDILLGFDSIEGYRNSGSFFGALAGRYANRIANGRFELDGEVFELERNNGPNHLHGGSNGFHRRVWSGEAIKGSAFEGARFSRRSSDGEEGYPGNLDVSVTYKLTDDNEWIIEYEAKTDRSTVVNLTQHAYFNLSGHASGDVLGHLARLNASRITPVDEHLIPTGEFESVENTPFDFREAKLIGQDIESENIQIQRGGGYDHNFVVDRPSDSNSLEEAATVWDPESGRRMRMLTTEPGFQLYTGNFLDGSESGKQGTRYSARAGFSLETQRYPNSPNCQRFPSCRLDPGQVYESKTVYRFDCV